MNGTVIIDQKTKTATITVPITELRLSGSGATESLVNIKNEEVGQAWTDGRPLKMSLLLYVKVPGWKKTAASGE